MIFINYRRADASADARAVHAQLRRTFSEIFIDIDTIRKGVNFVNELEQTLPKTAVMLVLVGRSWLSPRLEKEDDFVRMEISGALLRHIPIIPVLLNDAEMPAAADLPENLRPLSLLNAARVGHITFAQDMNALSQEISSTLRRSRPLKWFWRRIQLRGIAFFRDSTLVVENNNLKDEIRVLEEKFRTLADRHLGEIAGIKAAQPQRIAALEEENRQLRRALAVAREECEVLWKMHPTVPRE